MSHPSLFSRRQFLGSGLRAGLGTLLIPSIGSLWRLPEAWADAADPRYFLLIVMQGGADSSYLFDARKLEMTAAGQKVNFTGKEPDVWEGANGMKTLAATSVIEPLLPFRRELAVVNGVHMTVSFDGHGQNMNYLLAGDPFGGDSFVPHLAAGQPVDALQRGYTSGDLRNSGNIVPLAGSSAKQFVNAVRAATPMDPGQALYRFLQSRNAANAAAGRGRFARGAADLEAALAQAPPLAEMIKSLEIPDPAPQTPPSNGQPQPTGPDEDLQFVQLALELFRKGATRSAILSLSGPVSGYDAHDNQSAKAQPENLRKTMEKVALILKALRETEHDPGRSFLDLTTVMVTSEFSRTMRQKNLKIEESGTDHNPFTNSVLLIGRGIRGGLVLGESDRQAPDEKVSPAHAALDPDGLKAMGRPFDFATMRPRPDLPAAYRAEDYLNIASVVNTVYSAFGVGRERFRTLQRSGSPAPVLTPLLA